MSVPPPPKQPVTKVDLKAALANHPTKADLDGVRTGLDRVRTDLDGVRTELKQVQLSVEELRTSTKAGIEALTDRSKMVTHRIESVRIELLTEIRKLPTLEDLARHVNAIVESLRPQVAAVDEKYNDLPARVAALEAKQPRR